MTASSSFPTAACAAPCAASSSIRWPISWTGCRRRIKPLKRVVIETTGLADPAPVLQSVLGNPVIAQNFRLDGVVTVVDAVNGEQTIANHVEAMKQVAMADRLVISKSALAKDDGAGRLEARLRDLNPRAPIIDGDTEEAGRADLFVCGLYDASTKVADVGRWLQDEAHADGHDHDHHTTTKMVTAMGTITIITTSIVMVRTFAHSASCMIGRSNRWRWRCSSTSCAPPMGKSSCA